MSTHEEIKNDPNEERRLIAMELSILRKRALKLDDLLGAYLLEMAFVEFCEKSTVPLEEEIELDLVRDDQDTMQH